MKTADAITHIGRCDCGSKNFKRVYKKTFPATFDSNGQDLPAPDKLEWRAFECKDCEQLTHVCNIGGDVKVTQDSPCLPPSAYDCCFSLEDAFGFSTFVTDEVPEDYVRYDDLRDENLFGIIERLQTKYGIIVGNSMENTWDLSIDVSRKAEFPDYMSLFNYFKSALTEVFGTEPKCEHQHSTIEECIPDAEYQQKDYESTFFDVG